MNELLKIFNDEYTHLDIKTLKMKEDGVFKFIYSIRLICNETGQDLGLACVKDFRDETIFQVIRILNEARIKSYTPSDKQYYLGEIPNVFDLGDYVLFKKEFAMSEEGLEYIQNKLEKRLVFYKDVVECGDTILGVFDKGDVKECSRLTEDCLFVIYRKSTEVFMSSSRDEFIEILLHDYEWDKKHGYLESWGENVEANARVFM